MTVPATERLVSLDDIRAAARTLTGVALRTPLVPFGPVDRRHFLKAESLQPIGAFKIRGAYVAIAGLPAADRSRGVITYSSGNHAQGVARAARLLGAPAVVVMPSDAPAVKRARVAADGAEIVIVGPSSEERRLVAERLAAERGLAVIPPYDDDRIIAGQGTCGLEIVVVWRDHRESALGGQAFGDEPALLAARADDHDLGAVGRHPRALDGRGVRWHHDDGRRAEQAGSAGRRPGHGCRSSRWSPRGSGRPPGGRRWRRMRRGS